MTRRNSSLGFFGLFGRSNDLRNLDRALRGVDLHPALVPEGVKLAIVNLMKDAWPGQEPPEDAYPPVAALFGYCVVGPDAFAYVNGEDRAAVVERRIELALDRPRSLDAQLVLLTLHARLANPETVERFKLAIEDD